MQGKLCNRFGIKRYPTMKFGHATDFEEGNEEGLAELNGKLTAEEVVKWLSKRQNTYVKLLCMQRMRFTTMSIFEAVHACMQQCCSGSHQACYCVHRQYDYGSNKVLPHTVQNSSDASSAKGKSDSTEKVSSQ